MLLRVFIIFLLVLPGSIGAAHKSLIGVWKIETVWDSSDQFPWWRQIKYPKQLEIEMENGELSTYFTDEYGDRCEVQSIIQNEGQEIVFGYCDGSSTKHPDNWAPIHHAKLVNGKLEGVVTREKYLFRWIGERQ